MLATFRTFFSLFGLPLLYASALIAACTTTALGAVHALELGSGPLAWGVGLVVYTIAAVLLLWATDAFLVPYGYRSIDEANDDPDDLKPEVIRKPLIDDIALWPDGEWCYLSELSEMGHRSDDYSIILLGSEEHDALTA